MVHVHFLFVIGVAIVCYWIGIATHALVDGKKNAGDLLIDPSNDKVVFKFSVMPDELMEARTITMRVRKCEIHNSDSDETI